MVIYQHFYHGAVDIHKVFAYVR